MQTSWEEYILPSKTVTFLGGLILNLPCDCPTEDKIKNSQYKISSNAETNNATHTPKGMKGFIIHIMKLSDKSRIRWSENGLRMEWEGMSGTNFVMAGVWDWGESSYVV